MKKFGLVGKSLAHSFSKSYFEKKFSDSGLTDCQYENFEIAHLELIRSVLSTPGLIGLNVTIPYKEDIIPFLDQLDETASAIAAVNCIRINDGKTTGYNTDVYGFQQSIKPFLDVNHERALVLGTGGASKAVVYALRQVGVQVFSVTSDPAKRNENTFTYSDINEAMMNACRLIVNTTPLGTFPDTESCPDLPYQFFGPTHLAYDLVYNPAETKFLKQARAQGATGMNGLSMLQLQAEKSWEIWNR